ncbi:MAG: tryptophan--tRNA ligase [Candidatus Berkelbacteria bacterium]|nr:MAG: tryptophan--tRNA ligase [Candidatus Berkelbacteria bacterium]QQG51656.1 MAG: tryptophan--tRNA ligase [Candidatus Berkelbacteria bacterium]
MAKRLVSGIQPTGVLHIGNYLGAIKQWVELQDDYDAYFFIVDYHALTQRPKAAELRQNVLSTAAMLVALGIDPKSASLFVQSQVPEHAELCWLLMSLTSVGALSRMTQYKEKSDRHGQNAGLFAYPVLMAADILIYRPEIVPVGEDQAQHVELTRDIVETLNNLYGQTLAQPKVQLNKAGRVMALNNPTKKMSKSVPGSAITLLDEPSVVEQTLKRAVTDSDPNYSQMSPGVANLFLLLENFSEPETYLHFEEQQKKGTLRYTELKEQLTEDINAFLAPVQKTYHALMDDPAKIRRLLEEGAGKARPVAQETLLVVKKALGLNLND